MSRIPQPSSSRSGIKPPSTPVKSRLAPPSDTVRPRTISTPRATTPLRSKPVAAAPPPPPASPGNAMSIKEAIALKRAEARKAMSRPGGDGPDNFSSLEDALPTPAKEEEEDLLGRLSVRETIEQARSTGSLNLATRSLQCLPSALFEIHLGITSDPLKSVPNEPMLPASEPKPSRRGYDKPSWFEAQDLTVLKAWNNDIQEVQHEISLFGSLKTVDLHKNKLASLPNTFADLTSLTVLDLSYNNLTSLPEKIFALPELTTLNISHNLLASLPFNAPFAYGGLKSKQQSTGGFFTPVVSHANTPLPRLITIDASHNKIRAKDIDNAIPVSLTKIDLSGNPLGLSQDLLRNLSALPRLKEAKFEKCEIGDDSLPPSLFTSSFFVSLQLLDLSDTQVNLDSVKEAFRDIKQELNHDFSTEPPAAGVARILVGKRVVKEPWELELERREKQKKEVAAEKLVDDWFQSESRKPAASRTSNTRALPSKPAPEQAKKPTKPKEVVKEAWEIEAEQGLLTEGGRRRARAAAAVAQAQAEGGKEEVTSRSIETPSDLPTTSPSHTLTSSQYYTKNTQTLKLPASAPATKAAGHSRAFSVATPSAASFSSVTRTGDLSVPTPTLPLSTIIALPCADTLRVLILVNRRMDRCFDVPSISSVTGFLPKLEELDLEGCNLNDLIPVQYPSEAGASTPPRSNKPFLPTITKLFPSLRTLNLSYNAITNASLTSEALTALILASPHQQGLRHLRLRGNKISDLDGFLGLAEGFKGNRDVQEWKLEELDLRDNEIGKLPPEVGLLPLDVFLVDGNIFRVPARRVWEREGTKGLLSWLRGRIE